MIYELLERARGGGGHQPASLLLRLVKHKIEVTYAQPRTYKIITSSSEGVQKNRLFSKVRGTIYTREDPRGVSRIRKAPC
jgi:hypothetical protein